MKHADSADRLFSLNAPDATWVELTADGFSVPAAALIHSAAHPATCGMPLGGIDTGCIDLETDGTFGYTTIFNSLVPRGGPLNMPFLGFSAGSESWLLTTRRLQKDALGTTSPGMAPLGTSRPLRLARAQAAKDIRYWGHYPVADLEYDLGSPVSVGMRAWAPFLPGDIDCSLIPGAVFEVRMRNDSSAAVKGRVVFSFPGPSPREAGRPQVFGHDQISADGPHAFRGTLVSHVGGTEYALAVIGDAPIERGGDLGVDSGAWARIAEGPWFNPAPALPAEVGQAGASIGVPYALEAGTDTVVRFILAWHSPTWKGSGAPLGGGNTYTHMYAARSAGALAVVRLLAAGHRDLLRRILAWQEVVYAETALPLWLRESLVNNLHIITEDSLWAQARPPVGDWYGPKTASSA